MPKSESFNRPSAASSKLPGLMSRWMMPRSCAWRKRPADVDAHPRHLAPIERASPPQFLLQAVAVDQFHRIEQVALLLAEAEQPNDVRMVELAKRLDLGLEADAKAFFLGQGGGEKLDRGRLARLAVNAFVDRAHAAAAELADNLIGPKPFDVHGRDEGLGIWD